MLLEFQTEPIVLNGFVMRPANLADIPAVTELANDCAIDQTGQPDMDADELHSEWTSPQFAPAHNVRVVETGNGRIVGCTEVWDIDTVPVSNWVWGCVHPDFENQGIGTLMMDWAEQRLQETVARVPNDLQVVFNAGGINTHQPTREFMHNRQMRLVRHFWRMVIELNQPIPQPIWPAGIALRTFADRNDLNAVYRAFDDAFKDHWGHVDQPEEESIERWEHWIHGDKHFDPNLWFLATDGDQIAGICICRPVEYGDPDMGWVNILGVRRPWRRQGVGLAMLHHAFRQFQQRGRLKAGLGVDASSLTGATRLYEKAGMHIARQFDSYEKVLRLGRDIRLRTLED